MAGKPIEASPSAHSVTGNRTPQKRQSSKAAKVDTVTGNNGAGEPKRRRKEKPPSLTGYHWREDGAGWQLRREVYEAGKRKFPYIGHLSKSAYREMKRQHKGNAFDDALAAWIAERESQ